MSRALDFILEWIDAGIELYRESALCRALCLGISLFAGLIIVDGILGFPTGTRMAYVLPLWIATKRGGRQAGSTIVLLSTISLALVDSAREGRTNSVFVNFVLQTFVLYGLMLIFDRLESSLRVQKALASRDSLTGALNRLAIEERARKAIDRATVLGQPLTIAMVDCDRFKELNDKFGHYYGDEVLKLLSRSMRRSFLSDATFGRAGGDEFIVVMPNRERMQAISMLDAALDRFMSHTEIVGRSAGFSYGIAVVGEDGFEYERLIRAADEDMYRRKAVRSQIIASLAS